MEIQTTNEKTTLVKTSHAKFRKFPSHEIFLTITNYTSMYEISTTTLSFTFDQ